MKHLDALCCDACRAKVAVIELRAALAATPTTMAEAYADRRDLLAMVEGLLGTVATQRAKFKEVEALLCEHFNEERQAILRRIQQQAELSQLHVPEDR